MFKYQRRRLSWILLAVAVYLLVAAGTAVVYPFRQFGFLASFGLWIIGIPILFVIYGLVEALGTWSFGSKRKSFKD